MAISPVAFSVAGVIEVEPSVGATPSFSEIELTELPSDLADRVFKLAAPEHVDPADRHRLYVEIGPVDSSMIRFNLAGRVIAP